MNYMSQLHKLKYVYIGCVWEEKINFVKFIEEHNITDYNSPLG